MKTQTIQYFLAENYVESDDKNLLAGTELLMVREEGEYATCEIVIGSQSDYSYTDPSRQVQIPLKLIIRRTYETRLVEEKRLGKTARQEQLAAMSLEKLYSELGKLESVLPTLGGPLYIGITLDQIAELRQEISSRAG